MANNSNIPVSLANLATFKSDLDGVLEYKASLVEGKVPSEQLPSYIDDVIELLAMTGAAPATCAKDDKYFNTGTKKIFTATAVNTWGATGEDPDKGKIYINLSNDKSYRWSGSAMVEISSSDVTGIKVGASGSTISPSQGVIAIPEYEAGADVTDSENVKAALGTDETHNGAFLRKDGTWQTPPNTEYSEATTSTAGLMSAADKTKLNSALTKNEFATTEQIHALFN